MVVTKPNQDKGEVTDVKKVENDGGADRGLRPMAGAFAPPPAPGSFGRFGIAQTSAADLSGLRGSGKMSIKFR